MHFLINCGYNFYIDTASPNLYKAMEVLEKLLSVYKTRSCVGLYLLLRLIFHCFSLIDHYKFLFNSTIYIPDVT